MAITKRSAKVPKIRITKKATIKIREIKKKKRKISLYRCKKKISPGPWTEIETDLRFKAKLRWSKGLDGSNNSKVLSRIRGTYPVLRWWNERGWYPIYINLICHGIKELVEKHGMIEVMAAFEKSINIEKNQKELGTIVLLDVLINHSLDSSKKPGDRFISCLAKTTKRDIVGFVTTRGGKYRIIRKEKR